MLSLLFGYQIVVPDSYALDSAGFIEIAHKVVVARRKAGSLIGSPVRWPFIPGRRTPSVPHRQAIAARIEKPTFELSGWPEIDRNVERINPMDRDGNRASRRLRMEIANSIRDRSSFPHVAKQVVGSPGAFEDRIDRLDELLGYFEECERAEFRIVEWEPALDLKSVAKWMLQRNQATFANKLDDEPIETAVSLRHHLEILKENLVCPNDIIDEDGYGVFANRSIAHQQGPQLVEDGLLGEDDLRSSLEFLDTAYNVQIANSLRADERFFTGKDIGRHLITFHADEIAQRVQGNLGDRTEVVGTLDFHVEPLEKGLGDSDWADWDRVVPMLAAKEWIDSVAWASPLIVEGS